MTFKTVLSLAALSLPLLASARPATPEVLRLHNPDGSVVEARLHGDEFFSYTTSADGLSIMEVDQAGFWRPAVRDGRLLRPVESDLNLLRSEANIDEVALNARMQRMAPLNSEGRSLFPTIGTEVHSPVVLLEYADTKFTVPDIQKAIWKLCNEEGYSDYYAHGSAADYYRSVSGGRFNPIFDVYGPVQLQHNSVWYTGGDDPSLPGSGKNARFCDAIYEAVTWLDANTDIDFSIYDYDEDGKIDNIFFFYAGHGQADTLNKNYIWPHQGDYTQHVVYMGYPPIIVDGKEMATYACSNELDGNPPHGEAQPFLDGIGAFCHEFAHVLGLPDLYDTANSGCEVPGKWSVMDQGSYNDNSTCPPTFSAYERWVCNWLDYEIAENGTTYEIPSLTSDNPTGVRISIPRPGTGKPYPEYFVMESRSLDGWDAALPDEGMLIWRIDFNMNAWVGNTVNTYSRPRVKIMAPNVTEKQMTWPGYDGAYSVNYPGIQGALVAQSSYAPTFATFLTDITWDSENRTASVGYNHMTTFPTQTTVLHDNPEAAEGRREFTLTWDAVEGVEDYLVTVYRTDPNGKEWTVDGLREFSVGNATSVTVRNITATAWNQKFTAYVRVADKGIPANKTSNILTFTPSDLPTNGVETITPSEMGVSVGQGFIEAPADAEIYNMAGTRTGRTNLPAGIYIVRTGNKAVKVMVR